MHKTGSKLIAQQGEVIFLEGDQGDTAYVIEKGSIEIYIGEGADRSTIAVLRAGEIFGEMSILDGANRSASAVSIEETTLSTVSSDQLLERVNNSDPIVRLMITMLLKRNRENLKKSYALRQESLLDTHDKVIRLTRKEKKEKDSVISKIKFEAELQHALESKDFLLYQQPIMNLQTDKVAGFECLIRWNSPTRGMVRPDIFMSIAEETSLIIPMGHWILEEALKNTAKIRDQVKNNQMLDDQYFVSINISGRQLQDPLFFKVIQDYAEKYQINKRQIKLEITERILVEGKQVEDWIAKCRKKGFSIALDDFGTGYSSLGYISNYDVDNIKIDKSFTRKVEENPKMRVIVENMIKMAKGLNIPVIAEGVETDEHLQMLRNFRCPYAQGYLFSKPLPVEEIIRWLNEQAKKAA